MLVLVIVAAFCMGLAGIVYGDPSDDDGRKKDVRPPLVVEKLLP